TIQEAVVINENIPTAEDVEAAPPQEESPFIPQKGAVEMFNGEGTRVDGVPVTHAAEEKNTESLEGLETKELLEIINNDLDMMEAMQIIPGKNTKNKLRGIIEAHRKGELAEYAASLLPPVETKDENFP